MYADILTPKQNIICPVMEKSNLSKSQSYHNFHREVAGSFLLNSARMKVPEADANGSTQASQEAPSFRGVSRWISLSAKMFGTRI